MRILVQRFSALGDIAILLPILQALKEEYPQHDFAFCSRPYLRPLAEGIGLRFFAADLQSKHKGFLGLRKLANEIYNDFQPDVVIDSHAVLRTQLLNKFYAFKGAKVYGIDKDRKGRKQFLETKNAEQFALKAISEIHLNTFKAAGLKSNFNRTSVNKAPFKLKADTEKWWQSKAGAINIGIAPGARHRSKQWPKEKFVQFLKAHQSSDYHFFLFGGPDEIPFLNEIGESADANFHLAAGLFPLDQEIALMAQNQIFISNDSSNMHLAAWSGTKVISLWGGTHPAAGFAPYNNLNNMLSLPDDALNCRPCSIYGRSTCSRGDWACLEDLSVQALNQKVAALLA